VAAYVVTITAGNGKGKVSPTTGLSENAEKCVPKFTDFEKMRFKAKNLTPPPNFFP